MACEASVPGAARWSRPGALLLSEREEDQSQRQERGTFTGVAAGKGSVLLDGVPLWEARREEALMGRTLCDCKGGFSRQK